MARRILCKFLFQTILAMLIFSSTPLFAHLKFISDVGSFVIDDMNARVRLGDLSKVSGLSTDYAQWSQRSFKGADSSDEPSLWALFAQEDDIIGSNQSLGDIDPSRFYIPQDRQIHITEDTFIDGHGRTLELDAHARIVVDHGVTLTLCNMRIKNTRNNLANPIIWPIGYDAQVALIDVELALADDFNFRNGRLFIHDDVLVSGTHSFLYCSTKPGYICDGATFGFAQGSTFLYYPSSADNNLIKMMGKTASMYFDGATLLTTHTGMRLSKGMLCLDNNVTLSSAAVTRLSVVTTQTQRHYAAAVNSTDWSPDGKYLAIGGEARVDGHEVLVYSFDGSTLSVDPITSTEYQSGIVHSVAWSPDGKHLAVGGGSSGNDLHVYSFDGLALSESSISRAYGSVVYSVAWSSDGNYLAVGGVTPTSGNEVQVYSFNGSDLSVSPITSRAYGGGSYVYSVDWSLDGNHLAIGGLNPASGNEIQVYSFDGSALSVSPVTSRNYGSNVFSVTWSPDGVYLAVGGSAPASGDELQVYTFDGSVLSVSPIASFDYGTSVEEVAWSPSGNYLAIAGRITSGANKEFQVFRFTKPTLESVASIDWGSSGYTVSWRPDGKHIAFGGNNPSAGHDDIELYALGYYFDMTWQPLVSGIIFGDLSVSDGDLDVHVLAGAQVNVIGSVLDDSL